MLTTTRALIVTFLVVAATSAQAQVTTYIGGPKSGLTQTIKGAGAKATGANHAYFWSAQAIPVRPRVLLPRTGLSGGVRAIGADSASNEPAVRQHALRGVPARDHGASVPSSGAKAIGSDN